MGFQRGQRLAAAIAANGIDGTATQVWEGITKPYTSRWESGDQAGAIGYGAAELLITLAGTKGATKVTTTTTAKIETSIATKTESRVVTKVDELPCNCFVAGTKVQTAKGAKPIQDIQPGDQVWAKNLTTGESELRPVSGLFQKKSTTLMKITLATGSTVVVTQEHPFMVDGQGWVLSGDLQVGDHLAQRTGGAVVITAISHRSGGQTVYNFEVAGDHNYYVTDAQLLVHNCPIGEFGPQIVSRTVGKGKGWRIDVENPAPGVRDGQMHLQDYSGNKWQYDFPAGEFVGAPRSLTKILARDPAAQRAVDQGLRYLGEGG
ncbi:polymorphic toxin-type HINT domain-containing protein [Propionicimonas sp.]|uniref:polymorphic toxin-type HINT domain-containing protein n=1 Tax=Propionicimonas sp. TaxID=1955623 RepID=UPI0025D11618|nr:polymorphic toxin-type HINT domain-containing protein [Propionicimonas sp.]